MKIIKTERALKDELKKFSSEQNDSRIGFVPTMGALHDGHAQLIKTAIDRCDLTVVSIFVNPTQFNNSDDLKNYPRTEEKDAELLKEIGCDILFLPSVDEVYPESKAAIEVDLAGLDKVMEGAFRPGHFEGVVTVVNRLFEIVRPDVAFFGKKDFQQLAVIKQMVHDLNWDVEIYGVDIQRSEEGLALSSRNALLSDEEKQSALIIYQTLQYGRQLFENDAKKDSIASKMVEFFKQGELELEYLTVVDNISLQEVDEVSANCTVCIAAYCGKVRLIDNMQFGDF